jgi:hypothetical protein
MKDLSTGYFNGIINIGDASPFQQPDREIAAVTINFPIELHTSHLKWYKIGRTLWFKGKHA